MSLTLDQVIDTITECLEMGPANAIAKSESSRGFMVVRPGEAEWFPDSEWDDSVVSFNGSRVRIIAVHAKQRGNGTFSRLIDAILRKGWTPVVVCPLEEMLPIVKRWGWHKTYKESAVFGCEDQWVPPKKWKQARLEK